MIRPLLHAYWTGDPMPERWRDNLESWRDLHPDWTFTLWNDDTVARLPLNRYMDAAEWSPKSHPGQWRANLVRYQLLLRHGGFWIDCDLEPRRPIDELRRHRFVAAWETDDEWVNNAFLGAVSGHPLLVRMVSDLPYQIQQSRNLRSNRSTGAQYLTPLLAGRDDVTILPAALVYPIHYTDPDLNREVDGDPYCIHRWANQQRGRERRMARTR